MIPVQTVAVVDYGMGNLRSVAQALYAAAQGLNCRIVITSDPQTVKTAERVVLPGQGAMPQCMAQLKSSGLEEAVMDASARKPLLGVCVGMQMLLDESAEGNTPSLGLIPGQVVKFDLAGQKQPDGSAYKVPQMGWNRVYQTQSHALWDGIPQGSYFYFVHSYYAKAQHESNTVGKTEYGGPFTSAIARDNIFATQFHPEKSAAHGLALYRNFLVWKP